jgi:hypothetical protein
MMLLQKHSLCNVKYNLNVNTNAWLIICKETVVADFKSLMWHSFGYIYENTVQFSRRPGQGLNREPPEYNYIDNSKAPYSV